MTVETKPIIAPPTARQITAILCKPLTVDCLLAFHRAVPKLSGKTSNFPASLASISKRLGTSPDTLAYLSGHIHDSSTGYVLGSFIKLTRNPNYHSYLNKITLVTHTREYSTCHGLYVNNGVVVLGNNLPNYSPASREKTHSKPCFKPATEADFKATGSGNLGGLDSDDSLDKAFSEVFKLCHYHYGY